MGKGSILGDDRSGLIVMQLGCWCWNLGKLVSRMDSDSARDSRLLDATGPFTKLGKHQT